MNYGNYNNAYSTNNQGYNTNNQGYNVTNQQQYGVNPQYQSNQASYGNDSYYQNQGNANNGSGYPSMPIPYGLPAKENYSNQKVENSLVKRSEVIGVPDNGWTEIDDYIEKQSGKFLSSEIDELDIYHYQGHIFGMRAIYRDPWGKSEKETYKGTLHMATNIAPESCECVKLKLGFGEGIVKVSVQGGEYITYLRFQTNLGQVLELGTQQGEELKEMLPKDHAKVTCVAGTFNICMNSIYFYYM